ncbi:hypothetical protein [Vibrio parahaemolyticus]|uniref:hypothetical protein n=1 Tax=Vibrio parahaemolyticus TaxID=670 RepID=UPI001124678B|nr:hypothetical protein [Vibrio parahaemolyticus]MCR9854846.1 hypothetical protein [Vibrio parahaemolyticus]TOM93550.1 hypothetical protein CGH66_25205 [Vibrio parahaemolyticus]TOM93935.1 hypothetical protein CGH67_27440 [Vibrio parahaemolyticus]TON06382.1 hypothetical protein CGH64_25015 [Vibrio parahaemolyticus]TON27897.1 hypothetical protein CGH59_25285 [Vibrio parahaemolyticus]
MKYKLIKSMAHNFTRSFVGGCNYVDDAFVFEDLYTLAHLNKGKPVQISWVPVRTEELFRLTPRVRKSIGYYREWLPKHAAGHNVSLDCLKEFYLQVYMAKNHQIYVEVVTVDDRGKRVEQHVYA